MINETIYHHGVKGMKWGIRRFQNKDGSLTSVGKKRYYGMGSHELKKAISSAKRVNRKQNGMVFDGSTGKNWDKVKKELVEETSSDKSIKELRRKRDAAYRNAEKLYDRNVEKAMKYQDEGDAYQEKVVQRSARIGKKYGEKFSDALLKDINYSDVEKGKQMLRDYGVDVKISDYGVAKIVRNKHAKGEIYGFLSSTTAAKNTNFVSPNLPSIEPNPRTTKVDGPPYDEPKSHKPRRNVRY